MGDHREVHILDGRAVVIRRSDEAYGARPEADGLDGD